MQQSTIQDHVPSAPERRRRTRGKGRPFHILRDGKAPPPGYVELDGDTIYTLRHQTSTTRRGMTQGQLAAAAMRVQPRSSYTLRQCDICRIETKRVAVSLEIATALARALSRQHRAIIWQQLTKQPERSRPHTHPLLQMALPELAR